MSLSPLVSFKSRFVTYSLNFPRILKSPNTSRSPFYCSVFAVQVE